MPRCQRTFQRLPNVVSGARSWICPHCPDSETYERIQDIDLLQYASLAESAAIEDFGRSGNASRNTVLFQGLHPECIFEPVDRRYEIYLQQGSDALQLRLQIGHEVFHRVCSEGKIFHWTHEMMACLFSVRLLRQQGFDEYATQTAQAYQRESETCSRETLLNADLWKLSSYPPGFYGRGYVTGTALKTVVGWSSLCRLARFRVQRGAPDVAGWLESLPEAVRQEASCVLAG